MKQILLIGFILGLTNFCVSQSSLIDNKTFKKTFSVTEIQDIQLLFDFFNESICSDSKNQELTNCYKEFFKRMEKTEETGDFQLNIPFDRQKDIYQRFSDSTFSEIWSFARNWGYRDAPQDTFRSVYFNPNGKYLAFLKRTGRTNKVIKNYYELLVVAGYITPSILAIVLLNYDNFDINDVRVKFIVAIHYLTLNDQFERKEKINK